MTCIYYINSLASFAPWRDDDNKKTARDGAVSGLAFGMSSGATDVNGLQAFITLCNREHNPLAFAERAMSLALD